MGRIQGLTEIFLTGDQLVKTGAGEVHSLTLSWTGAVAGQAVVLRDAVTNVGGVLVPIVLESASGTLPLRWPQGKRFTTGLFVDFQGAGQVQMEMTYK